MLCPLYKSYTNGRIFFKLYSNIDSTRLCAEPMLSLCLLKVKVTLEGQNWHRKCSKILTCTWLFVKLAQVFAWNLKDIWRITSKICRSSFITLYCILTKLCPFLSLLIYLQSILDKMSGPLYKFYTNERIFFKLESNVHPNWAMCRTRVTAPSPLRTAYRPILVFRCISWWKLDLFKVKIDVCVRYNRISVYCVPTLCVLRTVKKNWILRTKRGGVSPSRTLLTLVPALSRTSVGVWIAFSNSFI